MQPVSQATRETSRLDPFTTAHWVLFGLFAASILLIALTTALSLPIKSGLPEALLVLFATGTTLTTLTRQLPGQTVALAGIIIGISGGFTHALNSAIGIPFGGFTYTNEAGAVFFQSVAWFTPCLWIVAILNSRGVARLLLRPWRKTRVYGFWLIGLTATLTLLLDFGLEPFASRIKHFWLWNPSRLALDWYGAPISNFIGWLVTTLLIMAFLTPLLTKKKGSKAPSDYSPLLVWILLNTLFAIAAIQHQLWIAAGFSAVAGVLVAVFAVRGARW